MYEIDKLSYLRIGVQGENVATTIEVDMTAWADEYPGASFHVLFKARNEDLPSPMTSEYAEPVLSWIVTSDATQTAGVGYTEIRAINPETGLVRKTKIIPTSVERSITPGESSSVPPAYSSWVNTVLGYKTDAEAAKDDAEAAQAAAEAAQEAAEAAAESVVNSSVRYDVAQTLTDTQKETARNNIAACSQSDADDLTKDIASIDSKIDDFIQRYYKSNNISQIPNVTKLAGYSFGPYGTNVSGAVHASYDSYYFYADADAALYFDSAAPSAPAYIAITVGYNPSKNWTGSSGNTLQMECSSVIRKRKSESNLPVSSEPLGVGGAIVVFTVNVSTTTNVYINNGLELQDEVLLNQAQVSQVLDQVPSEKSPKLIYTTVQEFVKEKSNAQINIYLPTHYGYIRYAFGHSVDANINADSWRIFRAVAVDENLTDRFHVTAHGEWEMALRLDGGTDFIGGILHGDEVMENVKFFLDGKECDISTLTSLTDFSELRIVENTILYNPDVANENVAEHSKEYIFTADGVTINQRVKWLMAKTLTTSYSCMLPMIRGNDTVSELQITADYYDDNDYKTYDVSVGGMSGYPFTWHRDVTRACFWAEESGIFASAEIVKQPPALTGGGMSFLQNTVNQYNKLYFSICGIGATYTTSANETWRWSQRYTISAVETD